MWIGGRRSGASGAEACMIGIDANPAGLPAVIPPMEAGKDEPRKDEQRTTAVDILEGAADGIDVVGLAIDGCKAVGKALQPSHLTGGKDSPASFMTGGGDGAAGDFHTVADCAPATDAAADAASAAAGAASIVGDIVSVAADVVGGIIGGIFDGL